MAQTHSIAILPVSNSVYAEIGLKLREAGYHHRFMQDGSIDLGDIAIALESNSAPSTDEPDRFCVTTPDGGCQSNDPRCMHQINPKRD